MIIGDQGKENIGFGAKQTDKTEFEFVFPLFISGTLGKSFHFSEPQFLHL